MGNKWVEGSREIINDPSFPFLDVVRLENGAFGYKPSIGREIEIAVQEPVLISRRRLFTRYERDNNARRTVSTFRIELLPPLPEEFPQVPAPVYYTRDRVQIAIDELICSTTFLHALEERPAATMVELTHGSAWGLQPENNLADRLRNSGYAVQPSFSLQGRAKRIHSYVIGIERQH